MILFSIIWFGIGILSVIAIISITLRENYDIKWTIFVPMSVAIILTGPLFPLYILIRAITRRDE